MCLELWVHCLVVCERPVCVAGGGSAWASSPDPAPDLWEALAPAHLQLLPPTFASFLSSLPEPLPTPSPASSSPALPSCPPPGSAALALPVLSLLSPVLSLLPLQLPADRVRQVHPVLRAPGPPSTSNQIPSLPRRLPFPSLPGRLFCDLTVAPKASPLHL